MILSYGEKMYENYLEHKLGWTMYKKYLEKRNSLSHHGILGQKWGVRRFQNADGTLTPKGKAHMNKVASSPVRAKLDTNTAKTILKNNARNNDSYAVSKSKQSVNLAKKAEKYAAGTVKNKELLDKSKKLAEDSKAHIKAAEIARTKIKDIDEGKIKAGRDFMVQRDFNIHLTNIPAYVAITKSAQSKDVNQSSYMNLFGYTDFKIIDNKSTYDNKNKK